MPAAAGSPQRDHCQQIEVGQEAVLRGHRDIRQAAVVPMLRGNEPELVAYAVPRRGSAAAASDADLLELFRPHLKSLLPDYMVPAGRKVSARALIMASST